MEKGNIMDNIQKELELIKESVLKVVPDTEAIYLFGSYAYGTPNADSDLDIYVVIPDNIQMHPLDVGAEIRMNLVKQRTVPLDLLIGRTGIFNSRKESLTLENTISREGIKIYG